MTFRTAVNRYGIWAAAGVLVVAGVNIWRGATESAPVSALPPVPPAQKEFFDIETHETVMRPASDVPPAKGNSGRRTLVEVRYATGPDGSRRVAYLLKYSDAGRQAREQAMAGQPYDVAAIEEPPLIASPSSPDRWNPAPGSRQSP